MRLLRAELGKLNRPLMWGVAIAIGVFSVLLAAGGSNNSHHDLAGSADRVPSCTQMGLPEGTACTRALAVQRSRIEQDRAFRLASARHTAAQLNPVAAGAEAAGLMASLPGALAIALLAGGHVGGEYSGRTLKSLLTQHGRRWQVLAAKLVSLWLAAIGLVAVCWAALAVAGPMLTHANHLPDPHQSLVEAAKWAGSQAARSLLVLAAFAMIGLLAAVLTRNTIGTMATTAAAFVAILVLASLHSLGRWTPATWVQGWMGYPVGERAFTDLPNNFWSRFINAGKAPPSHLLGLLGLVALLAVCAVAALGIFQRSDVA
jgi:ABC-type transport system involved in multi-copper enzyme maturation permease subunit